MAAMVFRTDQRLTESLLDGSPDIARSEYTNPRESYYLLRARTDSPRFRWRLVRLLLFQSRGSYLFQHGSGNCQGLGKYAEIPGRHRARRRGKRWETEIVECVVAEALARTGIQHIRLIDFDSVEELNLDRLLHAYP